MACGQKTSLFKTTRILKNRSGCGSERLVTMAWGYQSIYNVMNIVYYQLVYPIGITNINNIDALLMSANKHDLSDFLFFICIIHIALCL